MTTDVPNRAVLRDYVSVMRDAPADASIWDVNPEAGQRILDALEAMPDPSHVRSWDDEDGTKHVEIVLTPAALDVFDAVLIHRLGRVVEDVAARLAEGAL